MKEGQKKSQSGGVIGASHCHLAVLGGIGRGKLALKGMLEGAIDECVGKRVAPTAFRGGG